MTEKFRAGDLVHIDHNHTLFWNNNEDKSSPDFDDPKVFNKSFTAILIGSDFTEVYFQVLFEKNIFWVASQSLSILNSKD